MPLGASGPGPAGSTVFPSVFRYTGGREEGLAVKKFAVLAAALALLLCACAGEERTESPVLPPSYRIVYRMESYEGTERTSHAVLTAARSEEGFYYDAGDGAEFLFLEESADTYTMYIRSEANGIFSVSPGELVGREKVEQFAAGVLYVGLLTQDTAGLALTGEGKAAGRDCFVYEGARAAGQEYTLRIRLLIDRETGVTLGHRLCYTHRVTGAETVYVMVCELFETGAVSLPAFRFLTLP